MGDRSIKKREKKKKPAVKAAAVPKIVPETGEADKLKK